MPMTLEDLEKENEKFKAQLSGISELLARLEGEGKGKGKEKGDKTTKNDDDSVLNEAKKKAAEDIEKKEWEKQILESANFENFLKLELKDSDFFGENVKKVVEVLATKEFKNSIEKTRELKSSIIEDIFSKQDYIDMLPERLRGKAEEYTKFSKTKKIESANDYFEYVLIVKDLYDRSKKDEMLKKLQGSGFRNQTASDYENKFRKKNEGDKK